MKAEQEIDRLNQQLRDGRLAPDEPLFVLRAQDILAANVVDIWANMLERQDGVANPLIAEARRLATSMRRWPTKKVPGRDFNGEIKQ